MWIFSLSLHRPMRWLLHNADPITMALRRLPRVEIVNPLIHEGLLPEIGRIYRRERTEVIAIIGGRALVETSIVAFAVADLSDLANLAGPPYGLENLSSFLTDYADRIGKEFTTKLRYFSKQAEISVNSSFALSPGPDEYPNLTFPTPNEQKKIQVSQYEIDTAITWDIVGVADEMPMGQDFPVHNGLFLDAIHAWIEGDYRRSLLYSAMSMETYVASRLEQSYNQIVDSEDVSIIHRLHTYETPGQGQVRKDPIGDYLLERSKFDFRLLLHEAPLYLLGRSLLASDENLYRSGFNLHRARNKIVHEGGSDDSDETPFPLSWEGALHGIRTALATCEWYGMNETFAIPYGETVDGFLPESHQVKNQGQHTSPIG